ncbi:MAG: hypothetical protein HGB36_13035 [Chlorobiaceae bacterium]|nr:hypothetical protein [Chlorobiaceae bacterium]
MTTSPYNGWCTMLLRKIIVLYRPAVRTFPFRSTETKQALAYAAPVLHIGPQCP